MHLLRVSSLKSLFTIYKDTRRESGFKFDVLLVEKNPLGEKLGSADDKNQTLAQEAKVCTVEPRVCNS